MEDNKDELPDMEFKMLNDDELRAFVVDCLAGRIFTSSQARNIDVPRIFMVVAFGALSKYSTKSMENIGVLYEYMSEAAPRSINGYPIFFSMRILHKIDWEIALKMLVAEEQRQKRLEVPR